MSLQWASISYYYFCFFLGDTNNVRTGYRSSFFCPGCWRLLRFSRKNSNKKGRWGTGRLSQVSTDCFLNFLWICFVFNRHVPRIFLSMTLSIKGRGKLLDQLGDSTHSHIRFCLSRNSCFVSLLRSDAIMYSSYISMPFCISVFVCRFVINRQSLPPPCRGHVDRSSLIQHIGAID